MKQQTRTFRASCVAAGLLALGACSNVALRSSGVPSEPKFGSCTGDGGSCKASEALDALEKAQSYCSDLLDFYVRGGEVTGSQRLFVGVLGSLSGSVFQVVAKGSAAKAWGGLAGATNGIQTQLQQELAAGNAEIVSDLAVAMNAFAVEVKSVLKPDSNAAPSPAPSPSPSPAASAVAAASAAVGASAPPVVSPPPVVNAKKWDQLYQISVAQPGICKAAAAKGIAAQAAAASAAQAAARAATQAADAASAAAAAASQAASQVAASRR